MKSLKYLVLLGLFLIPASYAQAQLIIQVGNGGGIGPPPVCAYGYYPYPPYSCAPFGFWGPQYFVNGVFVGAGPWFHGNRSGFHNTIVPSTFRGVNGRGIGFHGGGGQFHGGRGGFGGSGQFHEGRGSFRGGHGHR